MNRLLSKTKNKLDNLLLLEKENPGLSKTVGSKITAEHLSIAVTRRDYYSLSLLLKTLGERVEENDEIKHFLEDLFSGNSDEKSEGNKIFVSEFLRHVIIKEKAGSEILKIVLNILGENAKNIITMSLLSLAIRNQGLDIIKDLVGALGEEKAQDMTIISYPLSMAITLGKYDIAKYLVDVLGENAKDKIKGQWHYLKPPHILQSFCRLSFSV